METLVHQYQKFGRVCNRQIDEVECETNPGDTSVLSLLPQSLDHNVTNAIKDTQATNTKTKNRNLTRCSSLRKNLNQLCFESTQTLIYGSLFAIVLLVTLLPQVNSFLLLDHNQNLKDHCIEHSKIEPIFQVYNYDNNNSSSNSNNNNEASTSTPTTKTSTSSLSNCPTLLTVSFSSFNDEFVIDLVKNERLISDRYFENLAHSNRQQHLTTKPSNPNEDRDFYKYNLFLNLNNISTKHDHCHYHGSPNQASISNIAISIVNNKLLSGIFHDSHNSITYHLTANNSNKSTILTRETPGSCDVTFHKDQLGIGRVKRYAPMENISQRRRSPKSTSISSADNQVRHQPFRSNSNSLYVELLVVHDHTQYVDYKNDTANIAERTMQIVNIMNAFYRQLNIFVALVGVVLWVEKDEIKLTDDGDATLTNFLKWRYEKLLPKYHHDNAQLITSTSFNGSVVGKALKGPICTHEHSGGVNTDHSHSPAIVAVTLAHELGHNFGMEHDEDEQCKCPDEKCIMSSSSSLVHPKHWSSCSIDYFEDAKKHGLLDCLVDQPSKVFGPSCGNGFVEDGEDCDPGEPIPAYGSSKSRKTNSKDGANQNLLTVANPCCDRQTCKFIGNATCAQGPCCDLTKCSVYNTTEPAKVCRPRKTECDFEEICDGKSEYCPEDVHYHDGIECGPTLQSEGLPHSIGSLAYNRSRAYCYGGKCSSHESQCQLLWGPSGSSSNDICYEQNIHGNTSGNCGYNRVDKQYQSCEPEDAACGMLHCVHNQVTDSKKTGKLNYGFESASILTVSYFTTHNSRIFCHGAIVDAGPEVRDPGLVPNGAACDEDRMCLNQKCVPIYDVVYGANWCPSDCNGNGICDNLGVCHCNDGTVGTSCYQFFGPNFHLSLLLYVVMFFIPIIALIVFAINHYKNQLKIWWFLHNRKIALRNKAREPQRRMAYEANGQKLVISDPIPLNQHNNTNSPFYEPMLRDPWAETPEVGVHVTVPMGSKSMGYRLEPLNKQPPATSNMKPTRSAPPPPQPQL